MYEIKCRKCRQLLTQDEPDKVKMLNAHSNPLNVKVGLCQSGNEDNLIFLSDEFLPDWINERVEEAQWTLGRLHCPHCNARIGAFDYVSGNKCDCNEKLLLPSVHVIKSKVDLIKIAR